MANRTREKRQRMLAFLEKRKAEHAGDDTLRAIGEIEIALTEKKYGLVFERHTERVDEIIEHNIPVFVEDETRRIVAHEDEDFHFLLGGDNLHSMELLEKTHREKSSSTTSIQLQGLVS